MNDFTAPKMHLVCPHCNATNRAPADKLQAELNCGQCHASLLNALPDNLGAAAFNAQLAKSDLPLVVDFWAPWCNPCVGFAPVFSDVAHEQAGTARFVKIDTEAQQALAAQFGIRSIPTIMVFKNGQRVDMINGALPKSQFDQWLNQALNK